MRLVAAIGQLDFKEQTGRKYDNNRRSRKLIS